MIKPYVNPWLALAPAREPHVPKPRVAKKPISREHNVKFRYGRNYLDPHKEELLLPPHRR